MRLLAEAGFPSGFDSGLFYCDSSYANIGEVAVNNFHEVGIRTKLQPIERAGFYAATQGRSIQGGDRGASGASATRRRGLPLLLFRAARFMAIS